MTCECNSVSKWILRKQSGPLTATTVTLASSHPRVLTTLNLSRQIYAITGPASPPARMQMHRLVRSILKKLSQTRPSACRIAPRKSILPPCAWVAQATCRCTKPIWTRYRRMRRRSRPCPRSPGTGKSLTRPNKWSSACSNPSKPKTMKHLQLLTTVSLPWWAFPPRMLAGVSGRLQTNFWAEPRSQHMLQPTLAPTVKTTASLK